MDKTHFSLYLGDFVFRQYLMSTFVLKPDPVAIVSVVVVTVFIFYLYFHHSNDRGEGGTLKRVSPMFLPS